jgi:hypothetical protein
MSLSHVPLECVNVFDPLIDFEEQKEFFLIKSGSQQTYYVYPTQSFSSSSVQFGAANPPSAMTVVNRKVYMEFPMRIVLSAKSNWDALNPLLDSAPSGPQNSVLRQGKDALRAYPLSNIIETCSVTINNQAATINLADITQAMMRYNTDPELAEGLYSQTPTYQDTLSSYTANSGANNNPLGDYGEAVEGGVLNRGGFGPYKIVVNEWVNAAGTIQSNIVSRNGTHLANGGLIYAVVDCFLVEPIFLSPFFFGAGQSQGFYSVSNMNFNFTFIGQQQMAVRMWSHDDGTNGNHNGIATSGNYSVAGVAAGFNSTVALPWADPLPFTTFNNGVGTSQPRLTFQYLTPLDNMVLPQEKAITYPYNVVIRYPFTQASVVAPGGQTNIQSQSLQLTTIPRRIYVWVQEDQTSLYQNTAATDTFFAIQSLTIQFQNKNGQLASATQNQLYQIAKKNGCNMSWTKWSGNPVIINDPTLIWGGDSCGTVGSVMCIELATDLGLPSDMCPGMLTQSLLQITCQCINISKREILPRMVVCTVQEGSWTIQNKASYSCVGVATMEDIKMANERPHYNFRDVEDVNGSGNFLTGLKSFFGKVGDFFKKHSLLSKGLALIPHPLAQTASKAAQAIGYGHDMHALPYGSGVMAGVRAGWDNPDLVGQQSHGMLAGKRLTNKQLAKRIMY